MNEPDFDALAKEWISKLEQEYWEEAPCACKKRLAELLRWTYRAGVKAGYEAKKQ